MYLSMKIFVLCIICLLFVKINLSAQIWKESLLKADSLIKIVEPINVYGETRFFKEFRGTNTVIKNDSLFVEIGGKTVSYSGRDIKLLYFFKPDPYMKWFGAAGGFAGAAGTLYLIDYFYNTVGYKFGITEYAIGTSIGSVIGYMIGRGIGAEKIEIEF